MDNFLTVSQLIVLGAFINTTMCQIYIGNIKYDIVKNKTFFGDGPTDIMVRSDGIELFIGNVSYLCNDSTLNINTFVQRPPEDMTLVDIHNNTIVKHGGQVQYTNSRTGLTHKVSSIVGEIFKMVQDYSRSSVVLLIRTDYKPMGTPYVFKSTDPFVDWNGIMLNFITRLTTTVSAIAVDNITGNVVVSTIQSPTEWNLLLLIPSNTYYKMKTNYYNVFENGYINQLDTIVSKLKDDSRKLEFKNEFNRISSKLVSLHNKGIKDLIAENSSLRQQLKILTEKHKYILNAVVEFSPGLLQDVSPSINLNVIDEIRERFEKSLKDAGNELEDLLKNICTNY